MASLGIVRTALLQTKGRSEVIMEDIAPSPVMELTEAWTKIIEIVDRFLQQQSIPRTTASAEAMAAATQTDPQGSTSTHSVVDSSVTSPLLVNLMSVLRAGGMVDVLRAYVLSVLDRKVKDEVAPRFWALLAPESTEGWHGQQEQKQQKQRQHLHEKEQEDEQNQGGNAVAGQTNDKPAVLEDAESETELPPGTRREAYVRVKRALLYVAEEVNRHLSLVRMLDLASAGAASGSTRAAEKYTKAACGGRMSTSSFPSCPSREETIEARYRCAFTAQVMAGVRGDFHGIMREFFDRNLRFWYRGWLEERRRKQQERRELRWGQGEVLDPAADSVRFEDNMTMDVSDDDDKEEEKGQGGGEEAVVMEAVEDSTAAGDRGDIADRDESAAMMEDDSEAQEEDGQLDEKELEDEEEEGVEVEEEDSEEEIEQGQEDSEDDDFVDMSLEELVELWGVLIRLGWFSLLQDAFSGVVSSHVLAYVRSRCDGVYDVPVLDHVMAWKDQVLLRWIALLLHGGDERRGRGRTAVPTTATATANADEEDIEDEDSKSACMAPGDDPLSYSSAGAGPGVGDGVANRVTGGGVRGRGGDPVDPAFGWAQRLGLAVHEAFCSARIAELFDIIADYPDSAVAIGELKTALGVTQQHQRLAILLRESVRRRLLHPGANTLQIIDVYIATIKVLRILDPKDVLLETVAGPVRRYLRARKDTVRCIVASLTDETSGDLYEELRRQDARPLDRDDGSDEDDDGPVAPNWEPASRDADPTSGNRSGSDILTMLVSIYGSKELFVTEYRLMLADKLVNNLAYDTDREVQNLELLKLRFGESSMHHCEIMVRDVEESKRVNANVQERLADRSAAPEQKEETCCLDAVMVSQHFWPQLLGDDMRLHPSMQKRLAEFSKAYSVIKNPRLLVWKKQLGVVQLTLEFGGVERSFSVSPLHATLIMHFEGKGEKTWGLSDLAREVALPPSVVQKKMMLWVNQGVIAESPGPKYRLIRNQAQARPGSEGVDAMAMEDNTEAAVSADANDKESDKVIEQFLTGMLTNLNKLPLNRIHNSLKMFMSGGDNKYEKSLPELQQLLWRLCSEGKLEQVDGEYRLVKQ